MTFKNFLGASTLALALAAPSMAYAADTWKPIGEGKLRDDLLTFWYVFDTYHEFKVEIQESQETPGRYRLVNAYRHFPAHWIEWPADYPNYLIVDASDPQHVYIEKGLAGIISGYDQILMVWSQAADYYLNRYGDFKLADEEGLCGKCVDGIITFPPMTVLVTPYDLPTDGSAPWTGEVPEEGPEVGFSVANAKGMFRLKLPGAPEVDMTAAYGSLSADEQSVSYTLTMEKDVEYALVSVVNGPYSARMEEKVISGEIPSTKITAGGTYSTPYDNDGQHTIIAVPYNKGNAHAPLIYTREWTYKPEWESIGEAEFNEAILGSCEMTSSMNIGKYTYTVQAERLKSNPKMVRIVDPYKEAYPESGRNDCDFTKHHYLTFDITDPNFVRMKMTEDGIGYQIGTFGIIEMWSRADREIELRGKTPEAVKAMGYGGTITNDNVLTFPKDMLLVRWPLVRPPHPTGNDWFWANLDGSFSIKFAANLNMTSAPEVTADPLQAPERIYTLQGIEVKGTPAPGVYIRVKNGKSEKFTL